MRSLTTILLIATLTIGTNMTATASAEVPAGPCVGYGVNKQTPTLVRTDQMQHLIQCAFNWAGIPGQTDTALWVADRESHFAPWAYNSYSTASGLYQHIARYWPSRARTHLKAWWMPKTYPDVSAFNERANALVTALMVRSGGWGPWT